MFSAPPVGRAFTLVGSLVRVWGFAAGSGGSVAMAGRGPLPRVAGERQRRNKRRSVELVPGRARAPAVRRQWLKATKEAWAAFWSSPLSDAVDRRTDQQGIYRLFTLLDLRDRAYRSYERQPFVKGSARTVVNPQASLMLRMDQEIRLLGAEFGLTPAARLRLGIRVTEAQKAVEDLNREWQADEVPEGADPRLKAI